jgi:hypothetical protein
MQTNENKGKVDLLLHSNLDDNLLVGEYLSIDYLKHWGSRKLLISELEIEISGKQI